MDLIDLRLMVAVADTGSITRGASHVQLSLPSASARIRGLERVVGTGLLDRGRRGVTPTPAGSLLVRHAREVCLAVQRMETEMADYAEGRGATVRLLVNTSGAHTLASEAVTSFLAAHPLIRIDLEERPSQRIVREIAERRAELGIVADTADLGNLETRLLRPDPLVVLAAPDHPLAGEISISYSEALEHYFVGLSHPSALHAHLERHASPLGSRPRYRVRLPGVDAVCRAVADGTGIAILPRASVASWLAEGSVRDVPLDEPWADRNLVLCFLADSELSTTARALRDYLAGWQEHPGER